MNSYFDENGQEKLVCPVCGRKGFSRLSSHLYNSHPDLSKDTLLEMYSDTKLVSDGLHKKQSDATKNQWTNPEYRKLMSDNASIQLTEQWKDSKFREIRKEVNSRMMKEKWENPEYREAKRIEAGNTLRKLWKDEEFRKRRIQASSSILNSLWNDEEWKEWRSQQQSEIMIERLVTHRKKIEYINRYGKLLKFRSHFEERFATFLDLIEVDYSYESMKFKYSYQSHSHNYIPDFFINELNLVVEVKPSCYINNEITQIKRKSVIDEGYNFMFITEDDLKDLFKSSLYEQLLNRATTIESITTS